MFSIFKNKFFLICFVIILILTIIVVALNLAGKSNVVSDVMNTVLSPFQKFGEILKDSVSGFTSYFTEFNNLKKENEDLRRQLEENQKYIEEAEKTYRENEMLYEYFDLKRERPDIKMLDASIIASEADNYRSVLTIDRGTFHGVKKGLAAVNGDNLVGFVSEADIFTSKITLILRPEISVGAFVDGSKEKGLVEGDFDMEKEGVCRFTHTTKDAAITVGDKIVTSGLSDIYPSSLVIGRVTEVTPDAYSRTITAKVQPLVDLYKIKHVMIITDFERTFK